MTKDEVLEQFASIIKQHGFISATEYDDLQVNKLSRKVIYRRLGKWIDALNEVTKYLAKSEGVNGEHIEILEPKLTEAEEQVKKLQQQVQELTRHIQTPKLCLEGTHLRFGYVSDSHLGSVYADKALLNFAYDEFEREKLTTVFNSGDVADGIKMYKGHEYELEVQGSDSQVNLIVDKYPRRDRITTYWIRGNHDYSFYKHGGTDISRSVSTLRPDMVCIGHQEADITIGKPGSQATIRLGHPDGGTAYAISYQIQRYIAELPSGTKPDVLLVGHYHKAEMLFYRGVCAIQGGTTQSQTPFMRGRKLSAAMGFWIVEVVVAPERVVSVTARFYPVRT